MCQGYAKWRDKPGRSMAPASRDVGLSVSMQKTLFLAESATLRFRIGYLDWSTVQGRSREELNSPKECFSKGQFKKPISQFIIRVLVNKGVSI